MNSFDIHLIAMTKFRTNPIICFLSAIVLLSPAKGQEDPFAADLQTKLARYNESFYAEKAYLMTDRYVYKPGEDLWFKGLVASYPIKSEKFQSADFFVRLINSHGEEIVFRRYPLSGNETEGRFSIPKSCIPGKYWLIAYTGWMRNGCPEEAYRKEILVSKYFEKRFLVEILYDNALYSAGDTMNALIRVLDPSGKPITETPFDYNIGTLEKKDVKGNGITDNLGRAKIKTTLPDMDEILLLTIQIRNRKYSSEYTHAIPMVPKKPEISFFPEGGRLIAGLKSTIVLKAVDSYQQPYVISGNILNSKGAILQTVHTSSLGLGKTDFIPPEDSCFLKINFPEGVHEKFLLPLAYPSGFGLHYIKGNPDSAIFVITASGVGNTKLYYTAVMNREIVQGGTIEISSEAKVVFPIMNLPQGILQFTLFDTDRNILAERLIHIVSSQPKIQVKMDQHVFHSRQRISVLLEYPKQLIGSNLSMSVSLNNLAVNSHSIGFRSFIYSNSCSITGNLKSSENEQKDIEMIASDFRSVYWNEILSYSEKDPYTIQDGLSGIVYDKKSNVSQHAKVRITHFPNFRLLETQSDENGIFHINFGSDIIDYKFLNIDAYDAMGKVNLNAKIDNSFAVKIGESLVKQSEENSARQKMQDLFTYGEPDLVYMLRFGPGKFRKSKADLKKKYDPYRYANYTNVLSIIHEIQPFKLEDNRIVFLTKEKGHQDSSLVKEEALIVINGALKGNDTSALRNIIPSDITNINISQSLLDVHKYTPLNFNGVIEITTIQGMYKYRQAHVEVGPGILNSEKEFYSPNYAMESSYSADNRKTLYWNPNIQLLQENLMLVTFYSSDVKGLYYGHITGIDKLGNPVEEEFTFRVE